MTVSGDALYGRAPRLILLSRGRSRRGARRSVTAMAAHDDRTPQQDNPTGGDETTEEQLDADNAVEDDMLKTLDPDDSPA